MELNELKAAVYDELVIIETHQTAIQHSQRKIAELNAEIQKLEREPKPDGG